MDASAPHNEGAFFGSRFREWRHNPCLMQPISLAMLIAFGAFMIITLALQLPALLLSFLFSPIVYRTCWFVEFLYPWDVARWGHFFLIKSVSKKGGKSDDKNRGFHSRTVEQAIEVVTGRVYIHPIPQYIDNLGWLVVSLPKRQIEKNNGIRITVEDNTDAIVAFLVDCGDATATVRAVELIQQHHYAKRKIHIKAILSTHKHHDHTGGNTGIMSHSVGSEISTVYAGAVEHVPQRTHPLVDGEMLQLPQARNNDMNELLQVEAIGVPAHTRGSLVYRLKTKVGSDKHEYMFTGDTMFCAGGGVPFEADVGSETETQISKSRGNTFVQANRGQAAMERCFAEILRRGMPHRSDADDAAMDNILIFPGHEYTTELLSRQFHSNPIEACRWKHFAPREFFETVSQMYVALHRRNLPHNSGKLLMLPSTLGRELQISPPFRSLRRAGGQVLRGLLLWYENFCKNKSGAADASVLDRMVAQDTNKVKTSSTPKKWIINAEEVQRKVFTTIYTKDLEQIIDSLMSGSISRKDAALKLQSAEKHLNAPVVNRRAIPGYLPSDKSIYRSIVGLVTLGSRPAALTLSDSKAMGLPSPIDSNSDKILISKRRLLAVLGRLGLLKDRETEINGIVGQLWLESREYVTGGSTYAEEDVDTTDEIQLGILKWVIFGVPANQPSWFSKAFCMPCSTGPPVTAFPEHPACKLQQKSGDLVSHDVLACLLCKNAAGGLQVNDAKQARKENLRNKETESDDEDLGQEVGLEAHGFSSVML